MRPPVFPAALGLFLLAACASPGDPSQGPASVAPSSAPGSQAASSTVAPAASADSSVGASAEPAGEITVDELTRTAVEGLSVRREPSTVADRLGTLPAGETVFVIGGPVAADGYTWYQLAGFGTSSTDACSEATPPFRCADWTGWAAGSTSEGDRWLEPINPECPPERDTAAYLSIDAVTRLACAGDDEWRLVAYLAPMTGGRGCFPVWLVDPFWMDPSCSFFFPQPIESEFDDDTSLQGFIAPELGACGPGGCPFDELKGSWVEVVGHLDDPVARTCTSVPNQSIEEAPFPPPDPDLVVFRCRLNFVVTEVTETSPPNS